MQELRILTNFGSFRNKSSQRCKIARKKLNKLLVLVYLKHFCHNFEYSEEITKNKSINSTSYFNTLIFNVSRFKMDFGINFEYFPDER